MGRLPLFRILLPILIYLFFLRNQSKDRIFEDKKRKATFMLLRFYAFISKSQITLKDIFMGILLRFNYNYNR